VGSVMDRGSGFIFLDMGGTCGEVRLPEKQSEPVSTGPQSCSLGVESSGTSIVRSVARRTFHATHLFARAATEPDLVDAYSGL
jgi:hypothetical protein